ncbi:MAG: hypothetical protein ACE5KP_06800 [Dehalococcoidales bacterium]
MRSPSGWKAIIRVLVPALGATFSHLMPGRRGISGLIESIFIGGKG